RTGENDSGEWNKRILCSSIGRDWGDRGCPLRVSTGSAVDSAHDQLSKSRSSVRPRCCAKSWSGRRVELRYEQFTWVWRNHRLRRARAYALILGKRRRAACAPQTI